MTNPNKKIFESKKTIAKKGFPMRINKYLSQQKYCTRRAADELIAAGKVILNGRAAVLGDKVNESDVVEVRFRQKKYRYFAYYKPRGIITHSAQGDDEEEISDIMPVEGVFPLGRLDKDSYGLILLTDDGRITDALLNPKYKHEKEYKVRCTTKLPVDFKEKMEVGIDIGGYVTKPCHVQVWADNAFSITLTEGKKHQIRKMCGVFGLNPSELQRVRVMNIKIGQLAPGSYRAIKGTELDILLRSLGF
jgi:23S rRNA pseudouridine2604 synthase